MNDVEMSDVVEEETSHPPKEITIDGSGCTTLKVPLCRTIVWELGVCMVQVRFHDEPRTDSYSFFLESSNSTKITHQWLTQSHGMPYNLMTCAVPHVALACATAQIMTMMPMFDMMTALRCSFVNRTEFASKEDL